MGGEFAAFAVESLGHRPRAPTGMMPVHNLYGLPEVGQHDALDPARSTVDRSESLRLVDASSQSLSLQMPFQFVRIPPSGTVAVVRQTHLRILILVARVWWGGSGSRLLA